MELAAVEHAVGGGVARRGGLQRLSEAKPMEVRSDRTKQPARFPLAWILAATAGLGLSSATMINRPDPSLRKRLRGNHF